MDEMRMQWEISWKMILGVKWDEEIELNIWDSKATKEL